jgi:DNA mismatch repair protein MutS
VDLVCGLAQAAAEGMWSEPELAEDTSLTIEGGRHPVAEALLEAEGRTFVANDCRMGETDRLWLLTGPNMAGKSTFLRQVAIIVLSGPSRILRACNPRAAGHCGQDV